MLRRNEHNNYYKAVWLLCFMSRVVNGCNVASRYTAFASHLGEHFQSLADGEVKELPEGIRRRWDFLFKDADYSFFLEDRESISNLPDDFRHGDFGIYSNSRRLIVNAYRKAKKLGGEQVVDERQAIVWVRDLTRSLLEARDVSEDVRKSAKFLEIFFENVMNSGLEDMDTRTDGGRGEYSSGYFG
jgi:hypothetical protein